MKTLFILFTILMMSIAAQAEDDLFFTDDDTPSVVEPDEDGVYRLPPIGGDMLDEPGRIPDDDGTRELRRINPCALFQFEKHPKLRHFEHKRYIPPGHYRDLMRRLPEAGEIMRRLNGQDARLNSGTEGPERVYLAGGGDQGNLWPGDEESIEDFMQRMRDEYGCDEEYLGASLSDQLRQSPTCANSLNTYCSGAGDADSCAIQHQHLLGDACYSSVGLRTDAEINGAESQMATDTGATSTTIREI